MERPERVVLIIIGGLFNRMAQVLWVIAVLANITVISRMIYTWQETRRLEGRATTSRTRAKRIKRSSPLSTPFGSIGLFSTAANRRARWARCLPVSASSAAEGRY